MLEPSLIHAHNSINVNLLKIKWLSRLATRESSRHMMLDSSCTSKMLKIGTIMLQDMSMQLVQVPKNQLRVNELKYYLNV